MEVGKEEGGGAEELSLGGGGLGGDNKKGDSEAMESDEASGELEERDDMPHAWAWKESYMRRLYDRKLVCGN